MSITNNITSENTIDKIMTRSVQTIFKDDTAAHALRIMIDGISSLPVVDNLGECIGMISRTDLIESLYAEDQELARHIETEGTASATFTPPIDTCNERLVRELMSDEQKVIGMVSSLDLIQWFAR